MKFIQNSAFLILFLLISGCGLILDIASLASGRPGTQKPDSEKTDSERAMDKMHREHNQGVNEMKEEQRRFAEEQHRRSNESFENLKRSMATKNP